MKKKMLTSLLLVASCLPALPARAQVDKTEWRLAVDVLKGKDTSRDKAWAVQRLEQSREEEEDAFVLNVLGVAYLHGIGTEADTARALSLFEASGTMGYSLAYHNLGMYYKYAANGRQDFTKAYQAFARGAESGHPSNLYNCGFMHYKGLGCTQDYAAAASLFQRAADRNHAPSLFMLGLCYRNGYGVEADTAIGNSYLRQAAELGQRDAMEELLNDEPESWTQENLATVADDIESPAEMPTIVPYLPVDSRVIAGNYRGLLVTYDWSGQHIISEKPLATTLTVVRDSAFGQWIQGADTIPLAARITDDGAILFAGGTEATLYDRYSADFHSRYRFEKVDMNYRGGIITGQLRLYSLTEMEPERPMYVCLQKHDGEGNAVADGDEYTRIMAYADPYSDRVVFKFELDEAVPSVRVALYSRMGVNVANFAFGEMQAGRNSLTITPDIAEGYYVAYVLAGNHKFQAVIVK